MECLAGKRRCKEEGKAVQECKKHIKLQILEEIYSKNSWYMERAGSKLEDILHTNNPWSGEDCGRIACLLCKTKTLTNKLTKQDCKKRSLVYEIWCWQCATRMEKEIKERGLEKKEEEQQLENIKVPNC